MDPVGMKASDLIAELKAAGRYHEPPPPPGSTQIDDDERPVIEELRALGVDTYGVHHLQRKADQHPGMRDVLFDHLQRAYPDNVRAPMAAALGGKKLSDTDFARLVAAYRAENSEQVRQQFASAVTQSAAGRLDQVIKLIWDRNLGGSRVLLVQALRRSRKPEAREALESLRSDPDLEVEIARRLKK
jgi:hypothetical protein